MLLDLLFPKRCVGCGAYGTYVCLRCERDLRYIEHDTCLYCQRSSPFGLTHPVCKKKLGVDGVVCCFHYNPTMKKIIKAFKYRLMYDMVRELESIVPPRFYEKLGFIKQSDYSYQPIPLHREKQRQ